MAITAYVGTPGSGKSYSVVAHVIIPALNAGRIVVTNIPLNLHEFPDHQRSLIRSFDLVRFSSDEEYFKDVVTPGAVHVIDEAWKWLPAGLLSNKIPGHFKSFLAEHRHLVGEDGNSTDVVFVTQDLSQVASFPRQLVEKTFRTSKLIGIGTRNKFRVDIYEGAVTGQAPPKSKLLSKSHLQSYKPDIYKFYKSHTMSESAAGVESNTDSRGSVFKSLFFLVAFPLALILGGFGIYNLLGFVGVGSKSSDSVLPSASSPVVSNLVSLPPPVSSSPPVLPLSADLRVSGLVSSSDGRGHFEFMNVQITGKYSFVLPFHEYCKFVISTRDLQAVECVYDGQRISFFSGSRSGSSGDKSGLLGLG